MNRNTVHDAAENKRSDIKTSMDQRERSTPSDPTTVVAVFSTKCVDDIVKAGPVRKKRRYTGRDPIGRPIYRGKARPRTRGLQAEHDFLDSHPPKVRVRDLGPFRLRDSLSSEL
jgi:hypothetical protein